MCHPLLLKISINFRFLPSERLLRKTPIVRNLSTRARVDTLVKGKHGQDKRYNNTWQKPLFRGGEVRIHHSKRIQHTPTHSFLPVLFSLSCLIPPMAIEHFRIVFVFLLQPAATYSPRRTSRSGKLWGKKMRTRISSEYLIRLYNIQSEAPNVLITPISKQSSYSDTNASYII